jgi:tetratricopeptide (TPR) repeat protein
MDRRSREAMEASRKVASNHGHTVPEGLMGFAHLLEALPLLTMVRFGQWDTIVNEPVPAPHQPFVRSMYHFARGMAFSAGEKPVQAKAELESAQQYASDPALESVKILDLNPLADIAEIGIWMLRSDIAEETGLHQEAITAFRRAVVIEDGLLYSEPPDWFVSPRHYLGHAWLMADKPAEAERVYREDLKRHRRNGWALRGLEESLRRQGRTEEADRVRTEFQRAWQRADIKLAASRF